MRLSYVEHRETFHQLSENAPYQMAKHVLNLIAMMEFFIPVVVPQFFYDLFTCRHKIMVWLSVFRITKLAVICYIMSTSVSLS